MHYTLIDSPLGALLAIADPGQSALVGLFFVATDHAPRPGADWIASADHPVLQATRLQLHEYFTGARHRFALPLRPIGTPFQSQVWQILEDIPFGRTTSYGVMAAQLGKPGAARAVGAANARNPISIIIPCHRAIGGDGRLNGYAGGVGRKAALLAHEGAWPPRG